MTIPVEIYDDNWHSTDPIHLLPEPIATGILSTDRAESSYGVPVLVVDGKVCGPAEVPKHWVIAAGCRPEDVLWSHMEPQYLLSSEGQEILSQLATDCDHLILAAQQAGYPIRTR